MAKKCEFSPGDYVVYPAHGVGRVTDIHEQEISGITIELIAIQFDKDRIAQDDG